VAPRRRKPDPDPVLCAVYCRVSTLGQDNGDFTSIDNQREACEAYITSQKHEGWQCLPERYDDIGFSGGTLGRPALSRLIEDILSRRVNCVVTYKLDRLSRSLLDFAQMISVLDQHEVSLVSVTQPINTGDTTGRLMLNILLSFAQYERETIADRTRDKIVAARKRGRWTGGQVPLGYDLHPDGGGLVVNPDEAKRVRAIFRLYTERESLSKTLTELRKRHWRTKTWTTQQGQVREGSPFQKDPLRRMLTNPVYLGKVRCKGEVYDGLHKPIVDRDLWDRVQHLLSVNGNDGGSRVKNKHGALLKGILRCAHCGSAMTHTFTKKKCRLYRYYVCVRNQNHGRGSCPTKSVPALEIERAIVSRIQVIGKDRLLVSATVKAAKAQLAQQQRAVKADIKACERDLERLRKEERQVLQVISRGGTTAERATVQLEDIAQESSTLKDRLVRFTRKISALKDQAINPEELRDALASFTEIWDVLLPQEQARVVHHIIQRIEYCGDFEKLGIVFHPFGIKTLLDKMGAAQ